MDNRYNYFADEEMNEAVRSVVEAKDVAHVALLTWREKMVKQLAEDILLNLEVLGREDIPSDVLARKSLKVIQFIVGDFAAGLLYGTEKSQ